MVVPTSMGFLPTAKLYLSFSLEISMGRVGIHGPIWKSMMICIDSISVSKRLEFFIDYAAAVRLYILFLYFSGIFSRPRSGMLANDEPKLGNHSYPGIGDIVYPSGAWDLLLLSLFALFHAFSWIFPVARVRVRVSLKHEAHYRIQCLCEFGTVV